MIPKVVTGGRTEGVLRYLVGKGRRNEHVDPRVVAGSPEVLLVADDRVLEGRDVHELAEVLDEPLRQFGNGPRATIRDEDGRVTGYRRAHVWHCSLSLHPDEPELAPERWQALCERFVSKMGLAGEGAAGCCRWVAVRHGRSAGGSDHAHVVVQLVGEDGRVPSTHFSGKRAQQAARELEADFGLRPLAASRNRGPSRWVEPGELECDQRRGRAVNAQTGHGRPRGRLAPENGSRQTLERVVRACATASPEETAFVGALRGQGVEAIPRYAKGGQSRVVGYSVRLPGGVRYAGGKLARDLTIGALRAYWGQDQLTTARAVSAWDPNGASTSDTSRAPAVAEGATRRPVTWRAATADVQRLRDQLRQASGDPQRVSDVAREASAVLGAWALSLGDDPRQRLLARASRELARAAQPPRPTREPPRRAPVTRPAALTLMLLSSSPSASEALALAMALQRLAEDLVRARRLKADSRQLVAQDARVRGDLARFGQELQRSPLPPRAASEQERRAQQETSARQLRTGPRRRRR